MGQAQILSFFKRKKGQGKEQADDNQNKKDATLIEAARKGDKAAQEQLICSHREEIGKVANKYYGRWGEKSGLEKSDFEQEIRIRILKRIGSCWPSKKFEEFVWLVGPQACVDSIRKAARQKRLEADPLPDPSGENNLHMAGAQGYLCD